MNKNGILTVILILLVVIYTLFYSDTGLSIVNSRDKAEEILHSSSEWKSEDGKYELTTKMVLHEESDLINSDKIDFSYTDEYFCLVDKNTDTKYFMKMAQPDYWSNGLPIWPINMLVATRDLRYLHQMEIIEENDFVSEPELFENYYYSLVRITANRITIKKFGNISDKIVLHRIR